MKRIIGSYVIIFIVVAIIGFGGVYSHRYLDRSASKMVVELEEVKKAVEQEKWKESRDAYAKFNENWDDAHKKWAMFTDHFELDNIEMRLIRGQSFIDAEDAINAVAEINEAIMLLEHIPERERLTLYNIF
ncbi:DUF4363 family protein [Syntrophaceticus schinkii]|jgi:predicted negative regulator of RcsB-dependent stress response|uniref:DUF4363 domain-containing protein n=1 Tax=Syntrophaceticus schinkii TaxID=499207 RepID=A0A0B7MBZ1_9FIRM|nr:DUF4363 family protein [Syntrophaceticus schinkii]CEO88049.1 hypothetical protein SSCH_1410005 [Syntrophaceticus schinkii]